LTPIIMEIRLIVASFLPVFLFAYPLLVLFETETTQIFSAFTVPSFFDSIGITLLIATIAALIFITLGTPLGYVMVRYEIKFKEVLDALIDIPIIIQHIR
jgi:ABC-type sulfate transport system permease component